MSCRLCINFEWGFLILFRMKRSRAPSFPITICERNLDLASEYLSSLNYSGPVGLSCDDTKLHPTLRPYWDASRGCHFLVGTTGEPIAVRDEGLLHDILAESKKDAATKVILIHYRQIINFNLLLYFTDPTLVPPNTNARDTTSYPCGQSNPQQSHCAAAAVTFSRSH